MAERDSFGALLVSLRDAPGLLPKLQRLALGLGELRHLSSRQRTVLLRMAGLGGADALVDHLVEGDPKTRRAFHRLLADVEKRPDQVSDTLRGLLDPARRTEAAAELVRTLEEALEPEGEATGDDDDAPDGAPEDAPVDGTAPGTHASLEPPAELAIDLEDPHAPERKRVPPPPPREQEPEEQEPTVAETGPAPAEPTPPSPPPPGTSPGPAVAAVPLPFVGAGLARTAPTPSVPEPAADRAADDRPGTHPEPGAPEPPPPEPEASPPQPAGGRRPEREPTPSAGTPSDRTQAAASTEGTADGIDDSLVALQHRIEDGEDVSLEALERSLDPAAPLWRRRRTLDAWMRHTDPLDLEHSLDRILGWIAGLDRHSARLWCLTTLAARGRWSDDAWARILEAADSPALRRRLAHRRGRDARPRA